MKRLAVLRHAKSDLAAGIDDFDRRLNERGRKQARRISEEMKRRKMDFDLVLASPAARVRETIDGLAETYRQLSVRFERRMYGASVETLLDLVRDLPADVESGLLAGHNPGLEQLVAELTHDDRVAGGFPTAALAVIELQAINWADLEAGQGQLVELILPKELD